MILWRLINRCFFAAGFPHKTKTSGWGRASTALITASVNSSQPFFWWEAAAWARTVSTVLSSSTPSSAQLERLPESGVHVLLCCEIRSGGSVYKRYVCDGYYAKKYTEQTWNNSGDIDCEYREEDDEYYLLEGWYEAIKNWDDYNSIAIHDFVTHWMPLPEPPKEE